MGKLILESNIERELMKLFASLGWEHIDCMHETFGTDGLLGRDIAEHCHILPRIKKALARLNPNATREAIDLAADELTRDRTSSGMIGANRDLHKLMLDGIPVSVRDDSGDEVCVNLDIIDWKNPENNDFLVTNQLWIQGTTYNCRADFVCFINGLPVCFGELKAPTVRIEEAFEENIKWYKEVIPQAFWHNAFIVISNGIDAKASSITGAWEHYAQWKKADGEEEIGSIELEKLAKGMFDKTRLLDIIENFIVFDGQAKVLAKNHQFHGVNNACISLLDREKNKGSLGVFWHTQGSGKSYSMIFFCRKVSRKIPGNWTFLIITDRADLDRQIYENFARTGTVTTNFARASSCRDLREKLSNQNHKFVFTLIHKFADVEGENYPVLSERSDIIVITDEAHRSQYDTLAMNMRIALPNASFIGFTGTPLIKHDEQRTRAVFGDYVSTYDFSQSIEDGATVPLYYENRIPELEIDDDLLDKKLAEVLEDEDLDERQQVALEKEFSRLYHLITSTDRLDKIGKDIVEHYIGRKQTTKAMVVCIDKLTAVKMYDNVQKYWKFKLDILKTEYANINDPKTKATIEFMEQTDMAVVVSPSQNETTYFKSKGYDIRKHRERMIKEDLEKRFKDSSDPFRIVFVCAMWITGFDCPSCSTIYLDKPMKGHTLMQTIARANRVFRDKQNGLIVDYIGLFRFLKEALVIYAKGTGGDVPIKPKIILIKNLDQAKAKLEEFLKARNVIIDFPTEENQCFKLGNWLADSVDRILSALDGKVNFLSLVNKFSYYYKSVLPDPIAQSYKSFYEATSELAVTIRSLEPKPDIEKQKEEIQSELNKSVYTNPKPSEKILVLNPESIDEIIKEYQKGRKFRAAEMLLGNIKAKLGKLMELNKLREQLLESFNDLIDEYNNGLDIDKYFEKLKLFHETLNEESKRAVKENLSEEQLAIFDIIVCNKKISDNKKFQIKQVVCEMLEMMKREKLVQDWRKSQKQRAKVMVAITDILSKLGNIQPDLTVPEMTNDLFNHFYRQYNDWQNNVYARYESCTH